MASAQTAATDIQDSQNGSERQREQSTILFPYQDLNDAIAIAKAVHELHGSSATYEQIAAHIDESSNSSGFRTKISAAKVFGLILTGQGTVTLTALGSKISDPHQEKAARVEAFLAVPLYTAVYTQFKAAALPPAAGLESAIGSLGVAQKQRERARQVFQRSAQQAGFFQFGNDRLVLPAIKASTSASAGTAAEEPTEADKKNEQDDDKHHPLIEGLIKALPKDGTTWPIEARKKWLQAAAMNFDYVYTDSSADSASIKVSIERDNSAK